jgi:hypothetical protein
LNRRNASIITRSFTAAIADYFLVGAGMPPDLRHRISLFRVRLALLRILGSVHTDLALVLSTATYLLHYAVATHMLPS